MATLCKHGINTFAFNCYDCDRERIGRELQQRMASSKPGDVIMGRNYLYDQLSKPKDADAKPYPGGYGGIAQPHDMGVSISGGPVCAAPPSPIPPPRFDYFTKEILQAKLKDDVDNLRESEASAFFIERWLKTLK